MSYIRAKKQEQVELPEHGSSFHGFGLEAVDFEQRPDIDCNLDDEMLKFVLDLIQAVDELREGEALVIWKEIF